MTGSATFRSLDVAGIGICGDSYSALCEAFQLLRGTQELSNQIERAPQIFAKQSGQILSNAPKISFIIESYPQLANTSMGVEVMSHR